MNLDPHVYAFVAYFVVVLAIGFYAAKYSSGGVSEFFIGGRTLSRFVVALSAVVSARSAWVFLGLSGLAYKMGVSAIWFVVGFITSELFLFMFFAPRIRKFSGRHDCITVPDFLAARLQDRFGVLRFITVVTILMFMLPYISSQFVAGGKSFAGAFELSEMYGIYITAGVVMLYTLLGGFVAVSLTDTVQAVVMIFGLVALPVLVILQEGGLDQVLQSLGPMQIDPTQITIGMLVGALGLGLGSVGNPHITARYMSIRDVDGLRYAGVLGTVWCVVMCWGAVFVGLAGRVAYPDVALLPGGDAEKVFPVLTESFLHPVFAGVVLAAIFAAIMSTADSQLLVSVSAIVRDIYQKMIRKGAEISQFSLVLLSRVIVFSLVVLAIWFGLRFEGQLHDLIVLAWSGPGAALGPMMLLSVFWKRMTLAGGVAGVLVGVVTVLLWVNITVMVDGVETPLNKAYVGEIVPGFFASLAACCLVSWLTRPPEDATALMSEMSN